MPRKTRRPLAPVTETRFARSRSGKQVCVGAETTDGKWRAGQLEDDHTTWQITALLDEPVVVADVFGTLDDCREYIARGYAQRDLDLIQAHGRNEHGERVTGCSACLADADAEETRRQLHGRRAA